MRSQWIICFFIARWLRVCGALSVLSLDLLGFSPKGCLISFGLGGAFVLVGGGGERAWLLTPFCLMWLLWLERNRRTFLAVSHSVSWLQSRLSLVLYNWLEGRVDLDLFTFLDFLDEVIG